MTTQSIKIGQTIPLKIKRLGINGEGIGYYKRLIVFVADALPKEDVLVKINKVTPKFAEGQLTQIKKPSKDRIKPPCTVYKECGGCQLQHLAYPAQLRFKRDLLQQALEKYRPLGYKDYQLLPTLGMETPWHYRNKAQFQVRKNGQTNTIEAGLYQPNSHQLVPITDCLVQEKTTQQVMNKLVELVNKHQLPVYNERKGTGSLRTLMVRAGVETKEVQVVFITYSNTFPHQDRLLTDIQACLPEVVSIVQNIQPTKSSLIMGDKTIPLWGKEAIEERLNELVFDLSARAFFQLNPAQTSILYREAQKALDPQQHDVVVDAYCGVGTIGLSIASHVHEVRGMDTIPQAISDAKKNAKRLGLANTYYETGTAEHLLPHWLKTGFDPTAIIVDPPRTGLDQQLLNAITKQPPEKMVYISCNVSTLARDLASLAKIYSIDYLQSVDMFPHTARCEVVVKLTKK